MLTESQASVSNSSGEKLPDVEMSTDTSGITQVKSQESVQSTFFSGQISKSNKSIPLSYLTTQKKSENISLGWC